MPPVRFGPPRKSSFAAGEVRLGAEETKNRKPRVWPMSALPELAAMMKERRARTERLEREQSRIIPVVFHRDGEPIRYFGDAWNTAIKVPKTSWWSGTFV